MTSPLISGEKYLVTFYVSLADYSYWATNNMGVYFSTKPISANYTNWLNATPQIEYKNIINNDKEWVKLETAIIATGAWEYLTIGNFKGPNATSILFRNSRCSGAYYFLDDVSVVPFLKQIDGETHICIGDTTTLHTHISFSSYKWALSSSPGTIISNTSTLMVSPVSNTNYFLYMTNDTLSITVNVENPFDIDLGKDTTICEGDILVLDGKVPDADWYLWEDSSSTSTFNASEKGLYWLKVKDGCIASDSINISLNDCPIFLTMPNFISPNADGQNDIFSPISMQGIKTVSTSIYNIWGHLVYTSESLTVDWDRGKVTDSIYYWSINYIDRKERKHHQKGWIQIMR